MFLNFGSPKYLKIENMHLWQVDYGFWLTPLPPDRVDITVIAVFFKASLSPISGNHLFP